MTHASLFGHQIAVERRGSGPPVVVLHGLATDRRVLVETCDAVLASAGVERIYLELPGHGESKGDAAHVSTDELLATLVETIQSLTSAPVALLGYAFGGYLVQGLLRDLPARGAFLICPTVEADFGRRTVPSRRILRSADNLVFSDDPRERAAFEEVAVLQTPDVLARFQTLIHPANIAADQTIMTATRDRYVMSRPYLQALAAFEGPVSIVCGRDDHWVGYEDAVRLLRVFRRGEAHVLPDCGHLLPIEAGPQLARAVADWLIRLVTF